METNGNDIRILRDLAKQYTEIASKPVQEERRDLWRGHFSLKKTRPPILISISLKDIATVQGQPERLLHRTQLVRDILENP